MMEPQESIDWLSEHGCDIIYQTRYDGVRGHFITLMYLPKPHFSQHYYHLIEGADLDDCLNTAVDWMKCNAPDSGQRTED